MFARFQPLFATMRVVLPLLSLVAMALAGSAGSHWN
jgi:hypothetical protein